MAIRYCVAMGLLGGGVWFAAFGQAPLTGVELIGDDSEEQEFGAQASGGDSILSRHEYSERIKKAESFTALGEDLFGDETNFYNGSTAFTVTDVDLPGNNALPVRVTRSFDTNFLEISHSAGLFADWELNLPHMQGLYAADDGWIVTGTAPQNRCSSGRLNPPAASNRVGEFQAYEFWRGISLFTPDEGRQTVLEPASGNTVAPTDGVSYPWATKNFWRIGCLPTLKNGTGEGFVAVAPNGTRYFFDWRVTRIARSVVRPVSGSNDNVLDRVQARLYATRVEDRFGNWVTYSYTGERLDEILASDGRRLALSYDASDRISQISAHGQTWTYTYEDGELRSVTQPDGSAWRVDAERLRDIYKPPQEQSPLISCDQLGEWKDAAANTNLILSFTHPSGAMGEFEYKLIRQGRARVNAGQRCAEEPDGNGGVIRLDGLPIWFDGYHLVRKTISGPGLPSTEWTAEYDTISGSYSDCSSCPPTTKTVTINNPDGSKSIQTYGAEHNRNEGLLLATQTRSDTGVLKRDEQTDYDIDSPNPPYPCQAGSNGMRFLEDDFSGTFIVPRKETRIEQDAVTFRTTVVSFDDFARPLEITRSSTLPTPNTKTEHIVYHDNLALWVLGQVARVTDNATGAIERRTEYNTEALPVAEHRFGLTLETMSYNNDGTLQSVADNLGRTTTLSGWKRGIPQFFQFHDGTGRSAVVNDSGWITSVTDERGHTTNYAYDAMGRIETVTYPSPDTVNWLQKFIDYTQLTGSELGVPAGSWRRQETLGNFRKRTYFDARLPQVRHFNPLSPGNGHVATGL